MPGEPQIVRGPLEVAGQADETTSLGEEPRTGKAQQRASQYTSPPDHLIDLFQKAVHGPPAHNPTGVSQRYDELMAIFEAIRQEPVADNGIKEISRISDAAQASPPHYSGREHLISGRTADVPPLVRTTGVELDYSLPPEGRSTTQPRTPTENIDALTAIWASDAKSNGHTDLLNFAYMPENLADSARFWSTGKTAESIARCAGRRVGMADVAAVKRLVESFRKLDCKFGGGLARMTTVRYLHSGVTPLLRASYSDRVGRHLFNSVADFTQLVGWMAYDVGAHGLAQRYFTQALRLTRATGDRSLGAYILSRMSRQATYLGYPKAAVTLGSTGREEAIRHATPAAMALFWSVEARGHGLLGDTKACSAALTQAERYLNSVTPDNEPTWSNFFDEAQLCDEFAHCYRDLEKPRDALHYAQRSLQLRGSSYVRSKAFCHTVLATAYLQMGEIEEACNVAGRLVRTIKRLHSSRGRDYLLSFWRHLSPYRQARVVREFEPLMQSIYSESPVRRSTGIARGAI